ncbi:MAG: putative DNA binding domain-containing protein [[Clostridium] fimetarium]|nr:putative DNA binding domain-containing protein [Alistipes timonensis]MCM1405313.1 putative DNA binding domain-containing protein [[Clostridium] fimetarium]
MNQENQNIEHKRIWKDEYLKWVSGFANAHGGKIYIGIDDDLTVVGVDDLHKQMEDLPNKIINNTGVFPETNHLIIDGKDVIEIIIEPSRMPISYRGVYYYRSGATKQELRGTALHQFLLKKMGLNWEDMPCDGTTLDDIDDNAISYFLTHAIDEGRLGRERLNSTKEEVLANLGLLKDGIPTNGAVLLFGKHPQRVFVTSSFKIGRFGVGDSDLLNQDVISGNLIQMTDKIMQVLSDKYLIRPIHYEGLQRKEPLEIPQDALREIIFNSIVHKLQIGTWNQMSIYDDRIQLWNEGALPEDYTVETLMSKHISKARNPKIAYVFFLAGFIEAWGRGYEKIMLEFDKANLKHPTFREEHGGVLAIIPREIFMSIRDGAAKPIHTNVSQTETELKPNQNRTKTEQKNQIVELIKSNPQISRIELSVQLGLHESSVQRRINALVKEGRLRHIGPTNGGLWEVIK